MLIYSAATVGKCFLSKVDGEKLTFIMGTQPKVGRESEFLDFVLLSVYNLSTQAHMPANIYDTEWRVMSSKIGGKEYHSFTNIEKTVPIVFSAFFIVTTCITLGLIISSIF